MTSAFLPPTRQYWTQTQENDYDPPSSDDDDETEDEEVKMNCIGGVADSDINMDTSDCESSDSDTDDEEDEEEDGQSCRQDGLLSFISDCPSVSRSVIRPRARFMNRPSPQTENDEDDEPETSVSVGARGVPLLAVDEKSSASLSQESEEEGYEDDDDDDEESTLSMKSSSAGVQDEEGSLTSVATSDSEPESDSESTGEAHEARSVKIDDISSDTMSEGAIDGSVQSGPVVGSDRIIIGVSNDCPLSAPTRMKHKLVPASIITVDSMEMDQPTKRRKSEFDSNSSLPLLPLSTGVQPAFASSFVPIAPAGEEDVSLDGQLREELDAYDCSCAGGKETVSSPVPLLTPPVSPQPLALARDDSSVVFEWPSNLAVDSAMRAVITDIQPLSPVSLAASDDLHHKEAGHRVNSERPLLNDLRVASFQV